ncbi:GGDEF domain-containing protein [Chromobacterium violaceum]|uniref:GGDEF domain-containing protein n=1 Tax=Chromobacterium violaceum TaxID=536 RepID=UPI00111C024D|nr:GGDEF domain-containing protein [Chromobacterium violaceum]QIY80175.1 GGDEF domain-containing protein [Chromobacterium violaceum]QRO32714.1 GGDEF domain-containing protein [Chromobacterium violaceum]QRQ17485.1 GGDEF domain-containing protein [Chromobacterium violaceum]
MQATRRRMVERESRLQVMRASGDCLPYAFPGVLVLQALQWGHAPTIGLLRWGMLIYALLALEYLITMLARRCRDDDDDRVAVLYRSFVACLLASSLGWGSSAWLIMRDDDITYALVVLLWMLAISAMQGALLIGKRRLFYLFEGILGALMLTRLFDSHDQLLHLVGVSVLVFSGVLIQFTAHLHRFLVESIKNRVDNQLLSWRLGEERAQLDDCNAQLERQNDELDATLLRIRELTVRDPLTGVFNMRALTPELERLLQRSEEQGAPFALSIIDLDYFKRINDECGHPTGDEVLQQLCRIVSATLKPGEVFARYGGEEFLLVTPDCNGGEHFRRMDALRAAIADYDWTPLTGILPVTISCGVASWYPGTDLGAMLQRADSALYMAKAQGRNRVCSEKDAI